MKHVSPNHTLQNNLSRPSVLLRIVYALPIFITGVIAVVYFGSLFSNGMTTRFVKELLTALVVALLVGILSANKNTLKRLGVFAIFFCKASLSSQPSLRRYLPTRLARTISVPAMK